MKFRNIAAGRSIGALLLLTALLCWGGQNNKPQSHTTIHEAAEKGDLEEVKRLLEQGADVNARDDNGETPLYAAANKGHKEVGELLIANGADINAKDEYGNPLLIQAIITTNKEMFELLIAIGAEVNARDKYGNTPLHIAARGYNKETVEVVELLIDKGADINASNRNGITPLHEANLREVAELLITKGADVNAKSTIGITPLHQAATSGHKEVAELLIASGSDVDAKDRDGWTPLHQAATNARYNRGQMELAELLISKGADINAKNKYGWTPLHTAASGPHRGMVELLIAKGADLNARDNDGKTSLQRIVDSKHIDSKDKEYKEMEELLTAAQEQRKNANLDLVEATRKVFHKSSASLSKRLAEINTLKCAFIDPHTRRVSFIGIYDPAYASGPIPYADLLAEALDHPYPSFSLDEGTSRPAVQAINKLFDKELGRISVDREYGIQWMKNIFGVILESKAPIPERLVLEQRLKRLGIELREFAAYLDLKKSNTDFTSEEQYRLVKKFMGKLFASIGIEERYGKALILMAMIGQMVRRGEDDKAIAEGRYRELGELLGMIDEMQNPINMRVLWVMLYSHLLKGLGVPARQVDAMVNRVDIHSNRFDAELAPALNARGKALAIEAHLRNIFKSFVLTQPFLKRMYSLPTIYSGVRLYGMRADSPLTRVMFDADYALKYVTTLNPDTAALPGHLSTAEFLSAAAERLGRSGELRQGYVREWIHPGGLMLEPFTDNSGVRFASATLRIGVEPLDDASKKKAWLGPVLRDYAGRLSERFDNYARLFPSLHVMREAEKTIALARWIYQNRLQVDVPKARSVPNPVPDRVEAFIDLTYVRKATGATDDVFVGVDGGVVFDQNEGDGWIKIQLSTTATSDVLEQLAASVALAEKGAAAALGGNMEEARDLGQRSADAMTGRIDMSGLPEPVTAPELAPNESVAERAEISLAAIAATEANTAALGKARTDLQQAEPFKTSDPARYAQIQQQSQATVRQSEQNLRHLHDMLAKYRLKPFNFPALAVDLRSLDPDKPIVVAPLRPQSPLAKKDYRISDEAYAQFQKELKVSRQPWDQKFSVLEKSIKTIDMPELKGPRRVIDEGVFLGMWTTQSDANTLLKEERSPCFPYERYADMQKRGKAMAISFGVGQDDWETTGRELWRALFDHVTMSYTTSLERVKNFMPSLEGTHFKRLIAHSNGATVAEALIRQGKITVDELQIVGGDRSLINEASLEELISSGRVKKVVVWVKAADPVPLITGITAPSIINEDFRAAAYRYFDEKALQKHGLQLDSKKHKIEVHRDKWIAIPSIKDHFLIESYFPWMREENGK